MEVPVSGRSSFDVTLASATPQDLGEVVITALGISKQARGLGYSATNVKPEELTINRTPNVMNALQGKVAGVNIIRWVQAPEHFKNSYSWSIFDWWAKQSPDRYKWCSG